MKILVADDDASSRALLQGLLEDWGYEVLVVDDGLKAWANLESATPAEGGEASDHRRRRSGGLGAAPWRPRRRRA